MIWMFSGKTLVSDVKKIHRRKLQVVSDTYEKSYEVLLLLTNTIFIHQNHPHFLATEIIQSTNGLNLQLLQLKPNSIRIKERKYNVFSARVINSTHE